MAKLMPWKTLLLIASTLTLLLGFLALNTGNAAAVLTLAPTDDAFVDLNNSSTNYDTNPPGQPCNPPNAGGLEVNFSNFGSFVSVREVYLQFDLSSVTQTTGRSLVNLTVTTNVLPTSGTLDLALYSVANDSWDETTINYGNAPAGTTLLETKQVDMNTSAVTFGSASVDNNVGTYIESERTGDGIASFLLKFDGGTGLPGFSSGTLVMEDRESCITSGAGDEPLMDMRGPTAVTLTTLETGQADRWVLPAALAISLSLSALSLLMLWRLRRSTHVKSGR